MKLPCLDCGHTHDQTEDCKQKAKICFRDYCEYRGSIQCDELCPDSTRPQKPAPP